MSTEYVNVFNKMNNGVNSNIELHIRKIEPTLKKNQN